MSMKKKEKKKEKYIAARTGRGRSRRTRLDDVLFRLDPASNGLQDLVNRLFQGVGMKLLLDSAASLENDLFELLVFDELVLVSLEILLQKRS